MTCKGKVLFNADILFDADQEMDGEALITMYVTTPGPNCLKDVVSCTHGLKIYKAIKSLMEVSSSHLTKKPKKPRNHTN